MGTGRGKSRRAKSVSVIGYDNTPWEEFLSRQGVGKQTLNDYYQLGDSGKGYIDDDEALHILKELFSDFVAMGALLLPTGYSTTDYDLSLVPGDESGTYTAQMICYEGAKTYNVLISPGSWFTPTMKLDAWETIRILQAFSEAVNAVY